MKSGVNNKGECIAIALSCLLLQSQFTLAATRTGEVTYPAEYDGGTLTFDPHHKLRLTIGKSEIKLEQDGEKVALATSSITELSYGSNTKRRIGLAAGLAVVSLGIGAIVAFSKSTKHYVGLTWDDSAAGQSKGAAVFRVDKDDYRGFMAAISGVTGLHAVDADAPAVAAPPQRRQTAEAQRPPEPVVVAESIAPVRITPRIETSPLVRIRSIPAGAEVYIDGEYAGLTPTAELKYPEGVHKIIVKRQGYKAWSNNFELVSADKLEIAAEMELDASKPKVLGLN
jgi:hypothetical protein